jgi:DNA integrity scanning protein DisA with diadenylate cyclase activity
MQKYAPKFYCKKCDYKCSRKFLWKQHISTRKHKMITNDNKMITENMLFCPCGKTYKYRSGLSRHQKKCTYNVVKSNVLTDLVEKDDNFEDNEIKTILKGILKENRELKEQMKNMKIGNITNNNNQKYTINMYLNDKCKNAMSLKDFVDNIKLSLEDLEFTSHHGFVEGISNIFLKNLNDMEITERPIHCSDQKRLQFYVKKEDKWEKDKQNIELDKSIKNISSKQIGTLIEWTTSNPGYENNPVKMEEYFQLVGKTMGVDCEKNIRKIKKIISGNVKLDV